MWVFERVMNFFGLKKNIYNPFAFTDSDKEHIVEKFIKSASKPNKEYLKTKGYVQTKKAYIRYIKNIERIVNEIQKYHKGIILLNFYIVTNNTKTLVFFMSVANSRPRFLLQNLFEVYLSIMNYRMYKFHYSEDQTLSYKRAIDFFIENNNKNIIYKIKENIEKYLKDLNTEFTVKVEDLNSNYKLTIFVVFYEVEYMRIF